MAEENDNNELNPSDMTAPAGGELEQTDDFGLMSGQSFGNRGKGFAGCSRRHETGSPPRGLCDV